LRGFIAELERRKLTQAHSHPVSAKLEITEIADRIIKHGRPGAAL
jgi:3-polyprenyl-4-hydroxybenzoate decarboxylase